MNKEKEIKNLEKEIERHDYLFWEVGEPEISDEDYHELTKRLKELDPENELLIKIHTPEIESSKSIKHKFPMLSLDKVYTIEELITWANKVKRHNGEIFLLENKFDGWSVEQNNGILSTRGDGFYGDDISNKLVYIKLLDGSTATNVIYVHGELVMLKSDFENNKTKILRKSGVQYKTPRTILTGLLTKDEIREGVERVLTLIPFNAFQLQVPFEALKIIDWDRLIEERKNADYPIDGLVLKLADEEYGNSLGATSHHVRSAMALKFTNPTGKTVLRSIRWSIGKHKITPVGEVDPVEIGGVIVDSPNLHNYKYVIDNDIHIGDTLIVERCGDIIPDVQQVIPGEDREPIYLKKCPACGGLVMFKSPELICINSECIGKHIKRLLDSVVRIGIERLGEPTLAKLISIGVSDLIDIFNLTKEDIIKLERFGESSSENLFNEIQKVKTRGVYEWQVLASLNIHGVGRRMSKMLLENMSLNNLRKMSFDQLVEMKGIGPERAKQICVNLEAQREYINKLLTILPIMGELESMETKGTICFTGKMPEKRSYYEKIARDEGYEPVSRVTKDLGLLVCMDPNSNSGKAKKARNYGTRIMHLDEWLG